MKRLTAPRILIVRLSAIGDCIHSLPVLCAVRDAYPGAFISWLVEGRAGDLLDGHPALDHVIRVPRKWLKSFKTVRKLRQELRSLKFDITVDPQGLTKSALAAWISGARTRIGFGGVDGRELSTWLNNTLVEPSATHVIDRNLELLRPLGIAQPSVDYRLPRPQKAEEMAQATAQALGLAAGYAVINPGAGWPSKLWSPDNFAAVARYLGEQHQLPSLVVWAGDSERAWAESIVADAKGHAHFAPPTSLTELAAITRHARIFVGSDTGPLHLAAALETPCVGLFGPMPGERNGPYGSLNIALQRVQLTGSSRERRNADNSSMLAITARDVCAACDHVLHRTAELGIKRRSA